MTDQNPTFLNSKSNEYFETVDKDHQNFYRRWEGLPDFDHVDCANDPNCLLK